MGLVKGEPPGLAGGGDVNEFEIEVGEWLFFLATVVRTRS